jgi:RES domain-containing protein
VAILYRIAPIAFLPRDFGGALLFEGRWHPVGTPVLYFCASLPGAILEKVVAGVGFAVMRTDYHFGSVAADLSIAETVPDSFYVPEWISHRGLTQARGEEWLRSRRTLLLAVKSATVGSETNFLMNPNHPDFSALLFSLPERLQINDRLK